MVLCGSWLLSAAVNSAGVRRRRNVPVRGQAETTANKSSLLKSLVRTIDGQTFVRVARRDVYVEQSNERSQLISTASGICHFTKCSYALAQN